MNNGFGKPKYGNASESSYSKLFKLEDGKELIVRILPPMKSLADSGKWALFHSVHYGYYGVNKKEPSKLSARPFKCVEEKNFRTGMITKSCPECVEIANKKSILEERTENFSKRTDLSEEEKQVILEPLESFIRKHNVDRKWYINVMDVSGAFGHVTISHRLKKQLDDLMEKIRNNEGVDPISIEQGIWLSFRRTGKKLSVVDTVEAVYNREELNGRKVNVLKVAPLTDQQVSDALVQCHDLTEIVRSISIDQMNLLVGSSGDPEEVDKVFALGSFSRTDRERSASRREASAQATAYTAAAKTVAVTNVAPATTSDQDEEALLMAKLAAIRPNKQKMVATDTGGTIV